MSAARDRLVRALQRAHAGELGAALAYVGHRRSVRGTPDARLIGRILRDELAHRRLLRHLLDDLGADPDPRRERLMRWIGRTVGFLCNVGGWYVPMYGAARLEAGNVVEYEVAARLAQRAGRPADAETLLHLAEVEWDHERALRERTASHWAWRLSPKWRVPERPKRELVARPRARSGQRAAS